MLKNMAYSFLKVQKNVKYKTKEEKSEVFCRMFIKIFKK